MKSGRTNEEGSGGKEALENQPKVQEGGRSRNPQRQVASGQAAAAMPFFIEPQLASLVFEIRPAGEGMAA